MIRVALFLTAIAQMALIARAEAPQASKPSKQVMDSYYAKRQQAKTDVAEKQSAAGYGGPAAGTANPTFGLVATPVVSQGMTPGDSGTPGVIDPQSAYMSPRGDDNAEDDGQGQSGTAAIPRLMNYANTPEQYVTGGEEVQSPQPTGGGDGEYCEGEGEGDGDCEDGYCAPQSSCFMDAVRSVPTTNVLWNELYSCRSMWADVDYLGFWVKGNRVPALVTTSPIGTPQAQAGVLGQPGTSILFGNQALNTDMRSGGRITFGAWLVGDVLAVEGNYWALGTETTNFDAASVFSNGSTTAEILARPFYNPNIPGQSRDLIAFPNAAGPGGGTVNLDGNIHITSSSSIQSAGVMLKRLIGVDLLRDHRMFMLVGYRWFRTEEGIQIQDNTDIVGTGVPVGAGFQHLDSFGVKNNFNGLDVGLFKDMRRGRWVLETTGKIAFGDMHETVNIDGFTRVRTGTTSTDYAGGVLTQPSNMGLYRKDQFSMIPELNLKLGYQITQGWRATAGYNFTYITRLARPGNEIDTVVSPPPTPGAPQTIARPTYLNNPTDMWLQGFTVGAEYRW
ncbi:MAG TPA: BBP7 family outer membrane beta-barrel protein [Pirellulales bacterium]|jgi:hypothetical protein